MINRPQQQQQQQQSNNNTSTSTSSTATNTNEQQASTLLSSNSTAANVNNSKNPQVASSDSIRLIGESIGIGNLSEEACRDLASDLTFTMKSILQDSLKFTRNCKRKKLLASDIDFALKFRTSEPLYGIQATDYIPFRSVTSGGRIIYYTEEQIINLDDIIAQNNQSIKVPNDISLRAHWLAIDGIQPSVPENPEILSKDFQKKDLLEGGLKTKERARKIESVKFKQSIPHELSYEHQLYFKEITEACIGTSDEKRNEALSSLQNDPGIHQLLPRLILFIGEGVRVNIAQFNMFLLIYLMRMARSIADNKHLYLEKYLHELFPAVISCILSKQLCAQPEIDNHWTLRDFAAKLVGILVRNYCSTTVSLQNKLVRVYADSLQSDRSTFATVYGAIIGLNELGSEIYESFVTPIIKKLGERVTQILDSTATPQEKKPAEKLKELVTKLTCNILKVKTPSNDELDHLTTVYGAYFGPHIHSTLVKMRSQAVQAHKAVNHMNPSQQQQQRLNPSFMHNQQQQNRPHVTQAVNTQVQQQQQQKVRVVNPNNLIRPKVPTGNSVVQQTHPLQQQQNQFNIQNQYINTTDNNDANDLQ